MRTNRLILLFFSVVLIAICAVASFAQTHTAPASSPVSETQAISKGASPLAVPSLVRKPQPSFGLSEVRWLQHEVGGYPLWQYTASLLWVIIAFLMAGLVDYLMTQTLKRLTARTKTTLDDNLLQIAHRPVKIIIFLLLLQLGVRAFEWPEWAENVLSGLFAVAIAATVTYLVIKLVDVFVLFLQGKFFAGDAESARLLMPILGKSLKVFIIIIAALTTAQYLGLPITSVIAGLGIGGIAIALAAQNTLANVFGSITILADRPFRVGDRVQVDKYDGMIEMIGLRSTRLRTLEGHLVTIPNKIMADSAICNVSERPNIRHLFTLSITYGTSPETMQRAVKILQEIYKNHPLTHDFIVSWRDFGPHSLDILIIYWCKTKDYKEFLKANEEINIEIKRRFNAAGIEFAFPTQTIHLETATQLADNK